MFAVICCSIFCPEIDDVSNHIDAGHIRKHWFRSINNDISFTAVKAKFYLAKNVKNETLVRFVDSGSTSRGECQLCLPGEFCPDEGMNQTAGKCAPGWYRNMFLLRYVNNL